MRSRITSIPPLTLISKKGLQDFRSVIDIVPVGVKDSDDLLAKIKKDPEEFYSQKEEWLDGFEGTTLSYEPFKEIKKGGASIYSIGVKYKNLMGEFLDQSFYVSTKNKQIYYIKALIPLDLEKNHRALVSEVVDTISSKN